MSSETDTAGTDAYIISDSLEMANRQNLFVSDIFYFMNALFPQNTPNFDFSNSCFLKVGGEDALTFTNVDLTTKHKIT